MPYQDYSVSLFLDGNKVQGLESLNISNNDFTTPLQYVGNPHSVNIRNGYETCRLNFTKKYYGEDNYVNRFGTGLVNAYILLNNETGNNIALLSGALLNYSINLAIGQQPTVSCDFEFYNQNGELNVTNAPFIIGSSGWYALNNAAPEDYAFAAQAVIQSGAKKIVSYNTDPLYYFKTGDTIYYSGNYITGITSIENIRSTGTTGYLYRKNTYPIISSKGFKLDLADSRNNNLIQSTINYEFNRLPIYDIGSKYPSKIYDIKPITITCNLEFEPDDYSWFGKNNWPIDYKKATINYRFLDKSGAYVSSLNLGEMELVQEQANISQNASLKIAAQYRKHYIQEPNYYFDISTLGNQIYLWIDANAIPNVTYSSSEFTVPILYDKGPRGMHFTGIYSPIKINANSKNGNRYLSSSYATRRYDNNRMTYNPSYDENAVEYAIAASGIECIFVLRSTGNAADGVSSYLASVTSLNYLNYGTNFGTQIFKGNVGRYLGTADIITTNTSGSYSSWNIIGISRGAGNTPNTGLWNGYTFVPYTNSAGYDSVGAMTLFGSQYGGGTNNYWGGDIGEILWMAPQSAAVKNSIIKHLAQKWGLLGQINPSL